SKGKRPDAQRQVREPWNIGETCQVAHSPKRDRKEHGSSSGAESGILTTGANHSSNENHTDHFFRPGPGLSPGIGAGARETQYYLHHGGRYGIRGSPLLQ